jgi:signal transduction histidine kinase
VRSPTPKSPFPTSLPPEEGADTGDSWDEERHSESGQHAVASAVALSVEDPTVRDSLSVALQRAGRVVGGDDFLSVATVVITDAKAGAEATVAGLRARTRSDAAIIVVLDAAAVATEVDAAYEAGAMLCLRAPADEHQLLAAIGSALDLHAAKAQADDLMRQLDVQTHLASLGRVTAGFTHEVSNPLAVLVANFDTVRDNVEGLLQVHGLLARPSQEAIAAGRDRLSRVSPGEMRDALNDMGSALDRIKAVLTTTRDFAQAAGNSRIVDVNLTSVAREVRRWAASELEGVEVQELLDEPVMARGDPRLVGQVVLNLVTNAAHAARQLPSPRVRLHVYGKETAILSVRDNGPGIPPELRDRIFEPFFTTRRGQGGTGLGLALCREYVAQMQGRLSLWSAPGRGACFRVHLPRAWSAGDSG